MKKQVVAIGKVNSLTEIIEVVQNTIIFLNEHCKSLNKILELRDKLKGSVTDEYANLVKRSFSSYKDVLDAYKHGVEAKILDASFDVTIAEKATKFAEEAISFYSNIFK